ncbi:MAG: tetratricopeptide repeat protein [Ignavibacteriales bacterium]|nr:tetratricopeptide repeat protein [Ignavibacteriales bacterium]
MKKLIAFLLLGAMSFGLIAYQCGSTEMTSAKLYIDQKNYPKAQEFLEKELAKNPKNDEAYYYLGAVNGELGDYDQMLVNFNKSLEISKNYETRINEQKAFYWGKFFNLGVMAYNNATNATDDDSVKMHFEKAAENFQFAITCLPDSGGTYKNLAYTYLNLGQPERSLDPLRSMVKNVKSAESYELLGELLYKTGAGLQEKKTKEDSIEALNYFNEAITALTEGKQKYPNNENIMVFLGYAYVSADRVEDAIDAFQASVNTDPNNQHYRYNYGSILLNMNEFDLAEEQLKKALELDPNYKNAIYNLAVNYIKWGEKIRLDAEAQEIQTEEHKAKFQAAIPLLNKYLEMEPNEVAIWNLLGKVYANLNMTEEAMKAFERAEQLMNQN